MFTVKNFVFLALAGTSLAAPQRWNGHWSGGPPPNWSSGWSWGGHSTPTTSGDSQVVTQTATVQPVPATPTPTDDQPTATATPTATASPSSGSGSSSGAVDYMPVVNEWRAKISMGDLTYDATLEANSLKTVTDSKGQMVHELNAGSFAQVLAPGQDTVDDFTKAFVGGWLCEEPSLFGSDSSICNTWSQGWSYDGQTGHAEILSSKSYSKIGCANYDGIWGCDLA